MNDPILVWLRLDLRLADHPALIHASRTGRPVIPVFIWAPEEEAPWAPGAASRWWLHQSLTRLQDDFRAVGSRLVLRRGPSLSTLRSLIKEAGACGLYWNRRSEPALVRRDRRIKQALGASLEIRTFNEHLLYEPSTIQSQAGKPFQVFTPFWKACQSAPGVSRPHPAPRRLPAPSRWPRSESLKQFALEPRIDWAGGLCHAWTPGVSGARAALKTFLRRSLPDYARGRDRPDERGTSRLSPHLHFGELGIREVWHAVARAAAQSRAPGMLRGAETFHRELGWREFAHHLLVHFPHTPEQPLQPAYRNWVWRKDRMGLRAWQQGRTGYALVDAGMRQLWDTGWMHNRVRMVVASFLVKDLLISWRDGAAWFWDTLVDADLANNTLGWQWAAGCSADAAPFFRIFNPDLQAQRFDPDGRYRRRWCEKIRAGSLHPLVDHAEARQRALRAYQAFRRFRVVG